MTVRSGGKVCWGGSGAIPPIPTRTETESVLQANEFVPAQAPFTPAPIERYYIAANGFSGNVIRFDPAAATTASAHFSTRFINKFIAPVLIAQVNLFTDNASINNIIFDLGHYSGAYPAGVYNVAPAFLAAISLPGLGAYKMLRFVFQVPLVGDCYQIYLRRNVDTNPGTVYCPHILFYANQVLS